MATAFLWCSLCPPHRMESVLQSVDQSAMASIKSIHTFKCEIVRKAQTEKRHIVLCNEMLHIRLFLWLLWLSVLCCLNIFWVSASLSAVSTSSNQRIFISELTWCNVSYEQNILLSYWTTSYLVRAENSGSLMVV